MPWTCPDCQADVADDTSGACPSCGRQKTAWTIGDRTRTLVVGPGKKRFDVLRGESSAPVTSGGEYDAATWTATDVASAVPKGRVRGLLASGLAPAPRDVMTVRVLAPGAGRRVKLTLLYEADRARDVELAVPDDGRDASDVRVLPVFGAPGEEAPVVDGVQVVDVSEATELGYAPAVKAAAAGKPARQVRLEAPGIVRVLITGLQCDLDKTFLLPDAVPAMKALKRIYAREAPRELLVVGHADATGQPDYNVGLSALRADIVAAYLRDEVPTWLDWYTTPHPQGRPWGTLEDQYMLSVVGDDAGPFYGGACDGVPGPATQDAVARFQAHANATQGAGLAEDGQCGPATREQLVRAYMAEDGTTLPPEATLVTHGCGEYHPAVATADGVAEAENRRTEVFFFPAGIAPPPQTPCPAPSGCAEHEQWLGQTTRTIDLRDGLGNVDVRVLDRAGSPVPDVHVRLVGVGADEGRTGPDGRLLLEDEVPGEATLIASKEGYLDAEASLVVPAGWQTLAVDLVLKPNVVDVVVRRYPGARRGVERMELRSDDGAYSQVLEVEAAAPIDETRGLLRFSGLPSGKRFSLYRQRPGAEWPVFRNLTRARLLPRDDGSSRSSVLDPKAQD